MEKVIKIYNKDNVNMLGVVSLDQIGGGSLPANITADEDGLYIKRSDGKVYPISHPDLSTQPSILPQRFGNLDIKEVLLLNTSPFIPFSVIPDTITIIEASAFNSNGYYSISIHKMEKHWSLEYDLNVPSGVLTDEKWLLIRYIDLNESGYGY